MSNPAAQLVDLAVSLGLAEQVAAELAARGIVPSAAESRRGWKEETWRDSESTDPTPSRLEVESDIESDKYDQMARAAWNRLRRKPKQKRTRKPAGDSTPKG